MKPDIAAYICTLDEEINIRSCIEAIRNNGYTDIVVVDASDTSSTRDVAARTGADVLVAPKGLAGQRQAAIEHCQHEYLMFVDADDRLHVECIDTLFRELCVHHYDAIQARLRVIAPTSYCQHAMDALLAYCIGLPGPSKMIGRPALYRTEILKRIGMDLSFNGIGNEDTALSIRLEAAGGRCGIGTGISFRHHPRRLSENVAAWKKYGLGDAMVLRRYPDKRLNILHHLTINYPVKRSIQLARADRFKYAPFAVGTGLFRLWFMVAGLTSPATSTDS